ncbi:MAG TPA: hypothetical protein VLK84_08580, partial [Longimicrobium sp.]|nr:hypothetical protein [Longimicrobium sp.]
LRKGAAEAKSIEIGPLRIVAPETPSALWVVDGQQRLTALAGGMARPTPVPTTPEDPYVVYFDAASQTFVAPPKNGVIPSTWVPVAHLLDASGLSEWIFNWPHSADATLRTAVFQAGTRLRQYQVPLYVVETDDEALLKDIFHRTNNFGKRLHWKEVHDALFGDSGDRPSTLGDLGAELQRLGMGRPDAEQLHSCLIAYKGLDVTRSFAEHYRKDPEVLRDAVRDALPALRTVLSFLKRDAEIPHLRLLPRSLPLVVLTRFFHLFPNPNPRSNVLLTRWTWRTLLTTSLFDERTLLRRGVACIREKDEEKTIQELLSLVPSTRPADFVLPTRFDARAAESRLALLGMASLNPIRPQDGRPVDVAALIEERDAAAFRTIIPRNQLASSPANRILLPGSGSARKELVELANQNQTKVFASHAITPEAAEALSSGKPDIFLNERKSKIESAVRNLAERLAAWERGDRPSVRYILENADEDI